MKVSEIAKLSIIALLFFMVGYLLHPKVTKVNTPPADKPLSTLTTISFGGKCNVFTVINQDSVWLNTFENVACDLQSLKSITLEKDKYPNLFKQGVADSSFISVDKVVGSDSLVIVSNNQPDHGDFSPAYKLQVNLKTGEIVEEKTN